MSGHPGRMPQERREAGRSKGMSRTVLLAAVFSVAVGAAADPGTRPRREAPKQAAIDEALAGVDPALPASPDSLALGYVGWMTTLGEPPTRDSPMPTGPPSDGSTRCLWPCLATTLTPGESWTSSSSLPS